MVETKVLTKKGVFFITSEQEKNKKISPPDTMETKLKEDTTRCLKKDQSFILDFAKNAEFIFLSRNQITSIATGLIPFLEHNDANRALMGSNMQRQAVPLKFKELPLTETGIETNVSKSSQMIKIARTSGIIKFVSKEKVVIHEVKGKENIKNNITVKAKYKNLVKNFLNPAQYRQYSYKLEKPRKSNQNTRNFQSPVVKTKDWVRKGQIITDGSATVKGKLAIGKSILVAYMTWEGYNFEDAIIISRHLISNDIFTSIHIKKQKVFIPKKGDEGVRIRNQSI